MPPPVFPSSQFHAPAGPDRSAAPEVPAFIQHFLGIDFGKKRLGIAVGNRLIRRATPCKSITAKGDDRLQAVTDLVREWEPQALVIGIPLVMLILWLMASAGQYWWLYA